MPYFFPGEHPSEVIASHCGIQKGFAVEMFKRYGCNRVLAWVNHLIARGTPFIERRAKLEEALDDGTNDYPQTRTPHDAAEFAAWIGSERYAKLERDRRYAVGVNVQKATIAISDFLWTKGDTARRDIWSLLRKLELSRYIKDKDLAAWDETTPREIIENHIVGQLEREWSKLYRHLSPDFECRIIAGASAELLPSLFCSSAGVAVARIYSAASVEHGKPVRSVPVPEAEEFSEPTTLAA